MTIGHKAVNPFSFHSSDDTHELAPDSTDSVEMEHLPTRLASSTCLSSLLPSSPLFISTQPLCSIGRNEGEKHGEHVGKTYDASGLVTDGYDYEVERLEKHQPIEYAVKRRYLQRYILEGAKGVNVGAGVGHYSELLARYGCDSYLIDVADR
jgi:hypothetical protein